MVKIKAEEHNEKWLLKKGWIKEKGFKVDHTMIDSGWDYSYWTKESLSDLITKVTFYTDPNEEEWANEELEDCIARQEDYDEYEKEVNNP